MPATLTVSARSRPQSGPSLAWSTSPFTCEGLQTWRLAPAEATAAVNDSMPSAAESVAATHCLLVSQVREILRLWVFEDFALAFAKFGYDHTSDLRAGLAPLLGRALLVANG